MSKARPFFISAVITGAVMAAISFFIPDPQQAKGTLFTGLIAAATIAAIPIYDIDRWPLGRRTLVHFLFMLVTVFPLLIFSGWYSLLVSVGVFILFGMVGWTIGYTVHRIQQKKSAAPETQGQTKK